LPGASAFSGSLEVATYEVQHDDTLSGIALKLYGHAALWPRIFEANRDVIHNPDIIGPPMRLNIPDAGGTAPGQPAAPIQAGAYVFPVQGYSGNIPLHWDVHIGAADLFASRGTPVLAMHSGKVDFVGFEANEPNGGNNLAIQGDDGLTYYYAHGDRPVQVALGTQVAAGTFLFGVGDTGNAKAAGPHLHLGIGFGIQTGVGPAGGAGKSFDANALLKSILAGHVASPAPASVPPLPPPPPPPAPPVARPNASFYYVVNAGPAGLPLRPQPNPFIAPAGVLGDGLIVEAENGVIDLNGRWRHVFTPMDGWAQEQFLALVPAAPIAGPVVQPGHPVIAPGAGAGQLGVHSVAELFDLVRRVQTDPFVHKVMVAAALTESDGNPNLIGDNGHAAGLWQLHDAGVGTGMSVAARCDPDTACAKMLPEFVREFNRGMGRGLQGEGLAAFTYLNAEKPFQFNQPGNAAELMFRDKWRSLPA
jgi:murein DD-endopeptidase MepM/ murein hydrolase activator NlpD